MIEEQTVRSQAPSASPPSTGSGSADAGQKSERGGRPSGRGPREFGRRSGRRGGRRFFHRRKVCKFCVEKIDHVDYKDVKAIGQFTGERGKILPRRLTGVCTQHQRQLRIAIKRARNIALLPFATQH